MFQKASWREQIVFFWTLWQHKFWKQQNKVWFRELLCIILQESGQNYLRDTSMELQDRKSG